MFIRIGTNIASPYNKVNKFGYIISPNISHMKNCADLNLGDDLKIFFSLHFLDSRLYLLNGVDFNFDTVTVKTSNCDVPFFV